MENLTIDQLKEIISYYVKKTSDMELSILQNQVVLNDAIKKYSVSQSKNIELQNKINQIQAEVEKEKQKKPVKKSIKK